MRSMAKPFIIFVERFYPDPFVFAIALTFVVFFMALGLTDAGPVGALSAWGGGLSLLLEFIAQIAITLITAHALAHTDPAKRLLRRIGRIPKTPRSRMDCARSSAASAACSRGRSAWSRAP